MTLVRLLDVALRVVVELYVPAHNSAVPVLAFLMYPLGWWSVPIFWALVSGIAYSCVSKYCTTPLLQIQGTLAALLVGPFIAWTGLCLFAGIAPTRNPWAPWPFDGQDLVRDLTYTALRELMFIAVIYIEVQLFPGAGSS